jgi:hypothetical protein
LPRQGSDSCPPVGRPCFKSFLTPLQKATSTGFQLLLLTPPFSTTSLLPRGPLPNIVLIPPENSHALALTFTASNPISSPSLDCGHFCEPSHNTISAPFHRGIRPSFPQYWCSLWRFPISWCSRCCRFYSMMFYLHVMIVQLQAAFLSDTQGHTCLAGAFW